MNRTMNRTVRSRKFKLTQFESNHFACGYWSIKGCRVHFFQPVFRFLIYFHWPQESAPKAIKICCWRKPFRSTCLRSVDPGQKNIKKWKIRSRIINTRSHLLELMAKKLQVKWRLKGRCGLMELNSTTKMPRLLWEDITTVVTDSYLSLLVSFDSNKPANKLVFPPKFTNLVMSVGQQSL